MQGGEGEAKSWEEEIVAKVATLEQTVMELRRQNTDLADEVADQKDKLAYRKHKVKKARAHLETV